MVKKKRNKHIMAMIKKRRHRRIAIILITLVVIIIIFKWYNNNHDYSNFVNSGNKALSQKKYDNAITLYSEALEYKNDSSISQKIIIAKALRDSKKNYDSAIKQMNNKKYLNAINLFNKVAKQDVYRYKDSQSKISECKKQYIAQNIQAAKNYINNNKLVDASKCVNSIIKLDPNNPDAKKLKSVIVKAGSTLTINQAINILKSLKNRGPFQYDKYNYYYESSGGYVNPSNYPNHEQILNNYYVFSVDEKGNILNSNLCVNKHTGEIYCADSSGNFITLTEKENEIINSISSKKR